MARHKKERRNRPDGTVSDEMMLSEALVGNWGILRGAQEQTLREFQERARVFAPDRNYEFYTEGAAAATNSLWIPYQGDFRIEHTSPDNQSKRVFHAMYGPGMPFGELEVLCKDDVLRGEQNITRAFVQCVSDDARVIFIDSAEFLLRDLSVIRNFARILCKKLLDTGAAHDTGRTPPRLKAALRLQEILEKEMLAGRATTRRDGRVVLPPIVPADIAYEVSINKQPVYSLLENLKIAGLAEENGCLVLPNQQFFQEAIERIRRGRKGSEAQE